MPGRISVDQVRVVAALARLELSPAEAELYAGQLSAVLDHVAAISSLDTATVAPSAHPSGLVNVFRPDEVRPSLGVEEVLKNAPAREADRFSVPRILGEAP